jgi:hypothetical protein
MMGGAKMRGMEGVIGEEHEARVDGVSMACMS